jgi:gag-polypeptide of LTR copia-type
MDFNIKISSFSGEKKDWERWSVTFLAKARLRGYRELLVGIGESPQKGSKDYDEFVMRNDIAYAELLIACDNDICLGIVNTSRTSTLPEGDAKLAWKNLVSKFEPVTKSNLIRVKKEFVECKLEGTHQDPDQWIQSLETMKRKLEILGQGMSEMDLIIHILHNLPPEYENTQELLENELENDNVNLDKVKEKLRSKFERLRRNKGERRSTVQSR